MNIEDALEVCQNIWSSQRNAIKLEIVRQDFEKMVILEEVGQSHFGGLPDVPEGFEWPSYDYVEKRYLPFGKVEDGETKLCHLHFIAQFNLEQISLLDKDNLLPKRAYCCSFTIAIISAGAMILTKKAHGGFYILKILLLLRELVLLRA